MVLFCTWIALPSGDSLLELKVAIRIGHSLAAVLGIFERPSIYFADFMAVGRRHLNVRLGPLVGARDLVA